MSTKIVKSAQRVFEILELFEATQTSLSAMEISKRLGYPLASTHELLKTMVASGYFTYFQSKRVYKPSQKLSQLVSWLRGSIVDDPRLSRFMAELNDATEETVNLSRQLATEIEIITGLECRHEVGVSSRPGTVMPVTKTLTGLTSLAHLSDKALAHYIENLRIADFQQYETMDRKMLQSVRSDIQSSHVATRCDLLIKGIGAVCTPIKVSGQDENLVIGIVGPTDRIKQNSKNHEKTITLIAKRYGLKIGARV